MPPYYALRSRLEGFDPRELGRMLTDREAVRLTLMRGTVHFVTVRDALALRPLVQHVIERVHKTKTVSIKANKTVTVNFALQATGC
jgi:hypothetical protein